jgi:hypothetical protein
MFAELGKAPAYLLSSTEIPPSPSGTDVAGVHRWYSLDSEKNYRKNPHPRFGPNDIEYRFNRQGYRCADFDRLRERPRDVVTLACIGSSGLFGTGLPEPLSLPALLQTKLQDLLGRPVDSWNMGVGGTGPEYVTRMLFSVLPAMRPDIVLLTTHAFNRREFIGETGRIYSSQTHAHWQHLLTDPERRQMQRACKVISNPYNHVTQFITNAKAWESLCDDANVMWLFTTEGHAAHIASVDYLMREPRKMVGPGMFTLTTKYRADPETGLARDMLHPGTKPTQELADILFARLLELYGDRLAALKSSRNAGVAR